MTIYHCVTGSLPPRAEDRLLRDGTRWPSQLGLAVPSPQWEQALKKAMALRPEDRFQRVTDFWDALNARPAAPAGSAGRRCWASGACSPGQRLVIRQETCLGTDGRCQVVYPPGSRSAGGTCGSGRREARFWAMDLGSAQGSRLDGRPMTPGLVYSVPPGAFISLGDSQVFRAAESG